MAAINRFLVMAKGDTSGHVLAVKQVDKLATGK